MEDPGLGDVSELVLHRYSPSQLDIVTHAGKKTASQLFCLTQLGQSHQRSDQCEARPAEIRSSYLSSASDTDTPRHLVKNIQNLNEMVTINDSSVDEDLLTLKSRRSPFPRVHGEKHKPKQRIRNKVFQAVPPEPAQDQVTEGKISLIEQSSTCRDLEINQAKILLQIECDNLKSELAGLKTSFQNVVQDNLHLRHQISDSHNSRASAEKSLQNKHEEELEKLNKGSLQKKKTAYFRNCSKFP